MMRIARTLTLAALTLAPAALAQKWEFGGGVGGGFYTSNDLTNPLANASAKFASNFALSGWLSNNNSRLWGGEIRYDYQRGDMELGSAGQKATFGAQSHAIHYDFHLHIASRDSAIRPFLAFGGGVKLYQGTGAEVAYQPLSQLALLTKTTDLRGLLSVGGGVKIRAGHRVGFRIEAHDYITPFPDKVIAPNVGSVPKGWVHDLVISAGISLLY